VSDSPRLPASYLMPGTSSFSDFLSAQAPDLLPSRRPVATGQAGDLAPHGTTIVAATFAHAAVFMGLYVLIGLRTFPSPWSAVLGQAVGNSVLGMVAFTIVESVPGALERRRAARRPRR